MKRTFLVLVCAFAALSSCKEETKSESTVKSDTVSAPKTKTADLVIPEGMEVWAEQVESQTDMLQPNDWPDEDWKATYKEVQKEKIFTTITDAVLKGELEAYSYLFDTIRYTPEQVKNEILNWNEGSDQKITVEDISAIKVKEKWFFDPKTYTMYKKVTDMAFFVNSYTSDGFVRGLKALFYVKLGKKNSGAGESS